MHKLTSTCAALVIAASVVVSSPLLAQPVLTSITSYNTDASGNATGWWRTNTRGADFPSNTYITQGSAPATDAFLYTGNSAGPLLGSGLALNVGTHTFYLWGVLGYQPDHGVSLAFGGATNPSISSWYRTSSAPASTLSGEGRTVFNELDESLPAGGRGLSAAFGDYTVEVMNWSMEMVTRNVSVNSYDVVAGPSVMHNVGRLELRVSDMRQPPATPVPEPKTLAILTPAVLLLVLRASHRRRAG